jgi:hypothetical protein
MKFVAITVLATTALTAGCGTTSVPVTMSFPEPPGQLAQQPCPDLKKLPPEPTLSDIAKSVSENYHLYYECAIRADAWNDWYSRQRRVFEQAGTNKGDNK